MPTVGIYFDDETYEEVKDRDDRSQYIQQLVRDDKDGGSA